MLAPIEDMTSSVFRTTCCKYGADLAFTELSKIEALARKNKSTLSRIELKDNTPTIIQLLGAKEYYFKKFLENFKPSESFMGFNLNLGCPSPQIIQQGQGCAMIRRISKTQRIINMLKEHGYNASIKMRLGINEKDKQNKIYLNLIEAVDADFFVVHARHGMQGCKDPADFSVYEECVKTGKNIIANGDIKTKEQIEYLKKTGVKGAMIGRAAISEPSIFNRLKGIKSPSLEEIRDEYIQLSAKYNEKPRYRNNILKHLGKPLISYNEQ